MEAVSYHFFLRPIDFLREFLQYVTVSYGLYPDFPVANDCELQLCRLCPCLRF